MRKQYKAKKRTCGLCKPHKRGWMKRWKAKDLILSKDLIMNSVLSKDAQQKINELLGQVLEPLDFASLIRVLSKIGEKRDGYNDEEDWVTLAYVEVTRAYMGAPTEPEGMAAVETYLMKLL